MVRLFPFVQVLTFPITFQCNIYVFVHDMLRKHQHKKLLIAGFIHQITNQRALQSKVDILMSGLAGSRQQNLISISDVLDLESAQKQFSCLVFFFSYHYNYRHQI